MIAVTMVAANRYEVYIDGAGHAPTTHHVTLAQADYLDLTGGRVTHEWLIVQSFRFLLEREPNTAILRIFELPVIGRYYPEYRDEIRRRLAQVPGAPA